MIRIELPKGCIQQTPVCWQVIDSDNEVLAEVDSFDSAFQFYLKDQGDRFKTEAVIFNKPAPEY